jgi:hypothetical protein
VPLEPLDRRQPVLDAGPGTVEERVRAREEHLPVLLAGLVEHVDVVAQVVLHDALVVPALGRRRARAEERTDVLDGREAVAQRLHLGAALGDREHAVLALAVEVDRLLDDVDRALEEVRGDDDGDVLVDDALGEAEAVRVPERAAPELVLRHAVGDQPAKARDVRAAVRQDERPGEERRRPRGAAVEAVHVARREVRAGPVQRRQQAAEGAGRQLVVGVEEEEELAARDRDRGVARVAEPGVVLALEPEARVVRRVAMRDPAARVGRAVVDQDRLEVMQPLREQ